MLRAPTALVGIQLQYPCALSDDLGGGNALWKAQIVRGDHLFPIWMVRDDWRVGGGGTISVQGGLLVAGTDGPGGGDHLFPIWMVRGDRLWGGGDHW